MKHTFKSKLQTLLIAVAVALTGLSISLNSLADSPKNIKSPDRHSVEVKGKVTLYRVQIEGMNLGDGTDTANAEVFVSLDSDPKMVYTLQLHKDSPPSNQVIADTLRDAYINKLSVTLYHQIPIKKNNNFKIHMVQLN